MLFVLCGLPRSGKSTLVSQLENRLNRYCVIVNSDNIRLALTKQRYNPFIEDYVSAIKFTTIKAQLLGGRNVIVDGTHTSINSIKKLEQTIFDINDILTVPQSLGFIFIDTPEEECIHRAILTKQEDLIPVIKVMAKQKIATDEYIKTKYNKTKIMTLESNLDCTIYSM